MTENVATETPKLTASDLAQFTGSETWYRHQFSRNITFTDGVKFVADRAGAYWLIDEIVLLQKFNARVQREEFQVWKLTVKDSVGKLTCTDGNDGTKPIYSKRIPFTDFPLPEITFWFANNVLYLPSEH